MVMICARPHVRAVAVAGWVRVAMRLPSGWVTWREVHPAEREIDEILEELTDLLVELNGWVAEARAAATVEAMEAEAREVYRTYRGMSDVA